MTEDQFRLADALDKIAEGYAAAAMVLRIGTEPDPRAVFGDTRAPEASGAAQAPSFEELPFSEEWPEEQPATAPGLVATPRGSLAICPAHGIAFLHGKNRTMFCPAKSDDPKWSNQRGYCIVTPKSAAAWLRQHA